MMGATIILDDGHGVETPGKRSPDGTLRENNFNEAVMYILAGMLFENGIPHEILVPEDNDIPLAERVDREHALYDKYNGKTLFISIHANAFGTDFNQANGVEVFHYSQRNKEIAQVFQTNIVRQSGLKDRGVKRANFYVLKYTQSRAVLVELGFMTNREELDLLKSHPYRLKCALALRQSIEDLLA